MDKTATSVQNRTYIATTSNPVKIKLKRGEQIQKIFFSLLFNLKNTELKKQLHVVLFLVLLLPLLSSCEVVGGIFKTGMGVGIFLVIIVIAIVVFFISKMRKNK